MSLASIVSAYVAFELPDEVTGKFLRKFFEKERPDVVYGHPEWIRFVAPREDVSLIKEFLKSAGYRHEPSSSIFPKSTYTLRPVFLDIQIPEADRAGFVQNLGCEMVSCCEVCQKPIFGGAHKHILQFCDTCEKKTVHTTPFFGHSFRCSEH